MRKPEAKWIFDAIADAPGPILNLGSSTGEYRTVTQPHIDREIFARLRFNGVEVVHADIKDAPGVDIVGDVLDPYFISTLKTHGFRTAIVSNVLEHVTDAEAVADACRQFVGPGGIICATGPNKYPFHADPIDTMYRPRPEDFAKLFNGVLLKQAIIVDGTLLDEVRSWPYFLAQSAWRLLNWPRNPLVARGCASRLTYAFRPYKVSCALIRV